MCVMNKKIKKIQGYLYSKAMKFRYENHFSGEVELKYLRMGPAQGKVLIVVLSSFTRQGIAARYNYVRTLAHINVPKLYILDDFGLDGRGSYYLGQDGGEEIYRTTRCLIDRIKVDARAEQVIYCGSSKGGWAAMMFGLADSCGTVIAGSPQYFLGNYAISEYEKEGGNKLLLPFLSSGLKDSKRIDWLNGILREEIDKRGSENAVYLCYSTKEHTYGEHIRYLLGDLKAAGREIFVREEEFSNHNDIALYFPEYLYSTINELVAGK